MRRAPQEKFADSDPDGIIRVTIGGKAFELFPFPYYGNVKDVISYGEKCGADMGLKLVKHFERHWGEFLRSVPGNHYIVFPKPGCAILLRNTYGGVERVSCLRGRGTMPGGLLVRRPREVSSV